MVEKDIEKGAERLLQEKVITYRLLESRLDALVKQRDFVVSKILETKTTILSIEEIVKSKSDVIFPLGSAAYVSAKDIGKEKLLVEIGGSVIMEKTPNDAKELLNKQVIDLQSALSELDKEMSQVSSTMNRLAPEIQSIIEAAERRSEQG